jgi:tripartite-type tricarboxylate transporter receptor subunit TctC
MCKALAAAAAPNGYTLYQPVLSIFVSLRPPAPNVPVHVPQDFLPIGFVAENPMFIAVAPSLGISTLPELIARANSLGSRNKVAAQILVGAAASAMLRIMRLLYSWSPTLRNGASYSALIAEITVDGTFGVSA